MAVYHKIEDVWTPAEMVYVKRNNVWTPASVAYVKRSGSWEPAFTYDVTPPDPPELSTLIVDNIVKGKLIGRKIQVGIRGGIAHNPNLRRIRILTTYNGTYPTTYAGGTYTGGSDSKYPQEPWSEVRYNSYGPHQDSSKFTYRDWPRNASDTYLAKPGETYYFAAWAEDFSGNWSAVVTRSVIIPKTNDAANIRVKSTRLQPNSSTSAIVGGLTGGDLVQRGNPQSIGMWFYGDQITGSIGSQGTPTIRNAQILIQREDDGGSPSANLYLFRHGYRTQGEVPSTGRVFSEITKIGTIAKGEQKWFKIPESMWPDLNSDAKGFGLYFKDPAKASAFSNDYSVIRSSQTNMRSGELSLTWDEQL